MPLNASEKQLFHKDSQINKGLRLEVGGCLVGRTEENEGRSETGSGWVPGWENRRE